MYIEQVPPTRRFIHFYYAGGIPAAAGSLSSGGGVAKGYIKPNLPLPHSPRSSKYRSLFLVCIIGLNCLV